MNQSDLSTIDPHTLSDTRLKAFWALNQLDGDSDDHFTATQIANYLVSKHKINTSRQAIDYALRKNKGAYHKNKNGYKLMELGRKELVSRSSVDNVVLIEADKPYTAKYVAIKSIFNSLRNNVSISDPYCDINTLDIIFNNVPKSINVKILTNNIIDKPQGTFARHLSELRKEGHKIEVGIYTGSDLHDRYIMDDNSFWLSGNSLNHLGSKESFIVKLGADIHGSMLEVFNRRWKIANKI